jgi:hypothetical protein
MVTPTFGPWQRPGVEFDRLYPGLSVNDGRQSGSICYPGTRIPLWAHQWGAIDLDDYAHDDDPIDEWEQTGTAYVHHLMQQRGEFARLLLVLADAERCEAHRQDRTAWWDTKRHRKRVGDQLRRCLAILEDQ